MKSSKIVVVGTSAGGLRALKTLVSQLPADFPAAIFIVQHMTPDANTAPLLRALTRCSHLHCSEAQDDENFLAGHIYLAPPNCHLLIVHGKTRVTKGARENRSRPGIDPLFRSAAVAYQSNVIGVLLTGYLDDGTSGLTAIQRCGGTCIVQDPSDAEYPDMPQNAVNRLKADYQIPVAAMGAVLVELAHQKPTQGGGVPQDIAIEAKIAERVLSDLSAVEALGTQVPFNCPNCGGVLWEISNEETLRFRCHTGHAFTAPVLLAEQSAKIEETLWIALRMFEERRNLLITMARPKPTASTQERVAESEVHIERIRCMLRGDTVAPCSPKRDGPEPHVAREKPRSQTKTTPIV